MIIKGKNVNFILIAILLFFMSIFFYSGLNKVLALGNNQTIDIKLKVYNESLNKDDEANSKLEFLTGELIKTNVKLFASGSNSSLKNVKLKITFPKENVDGVPEFSKLDTANSWEKTEDDKNWYVIYNYDVFQTGQQIITVIQHKMKNLYTQSKFETQIKVELLNSREEVLANDEIKYITKVNPRTTYEYLKIKADSFYMSGDNHKYDKNDKNDETYTFYSDIESLENNTKSGQNAPKAMLHIGTRQEKNMYYSIPGTYVSQKVKIVDKLPEGAIMAGEKDENGKYVYISPTNGKKYAWTYDSQNHTATYIGPLYRIYENDYGWRSSPFLPNSSEAVIELAFPDQSYNKIHENSSIIIEDYELKTEKTYDIKKSYINFNKVDEPKKYDGKVSFKKVWLKYNNSYSSKVKAIDVPLKYSIGFAARAKQLAGKQKASEFYLNEIIDKDLDDNLYYNKITYTNYFIYSDSFSPIDKDLVKNTGFLIIGVDSGGNETVLADTPELETEVNINDSEQKYKQIKIKFKKPLLFKAKDGELSSRISFLVETAVKQDIWESWKDKEPDSKNKISKDMYNSAEVKFSKNDSSEIETLSSKDKGFYEKTIAMINAFQGEDRYYKVDDGTSIELKSIEIKRDNSKDRFKDVEINDVIHYTFIPSTMEIDFEKSEIPGDYKIIENFKGTNKRALICKIGKLDSNIKGPHIFLKPTVATKAGENTVSHYLTWKKSNNIKANKPYGNSYSIEKDELDLNDDGSKDDDVLKYKDLIFFTPSNEFIVYNEVSDIQDAWSYNKKPIVDIQDEFFYKIHLNNRNIVEVNNVSVLDVLPYKGDHSIVKNKDLKYVPRGSNIGVYITEDFELYEENKNILEKFDVYYSFDTQGESIEDTKLREFNKKSDIKYFEKKLHDVKMIKLKLKEGKIVGGKEELELLFKVKAINSDKLSEPNKSFNSEKLSHLNKSFNSVALSLDKENNFIEGEKTENIYPIYKIKGQSFLDIDNDGIYNSKDQILPNRGKINLMNADGSQALDLNGNPITTNIDENGKYEFLIYKRGEYFIEIIKDPKDELSILGTSKDEKLNNHIYSVKNDSSIGKSDIFKLFPNDNYEKYINVAYKKILKTTKWVEQGNETNELKQSVTQKEFADKEEEFIINGSTYEYVTSKLSEDKLTTTHYYLLKGKTLTPPIILKTTKWVEQGNETNELKPSVTQREFADKEEGFMVNGNRYEYVTSKLSEDKLTMTHYYLLKKSPIFPYKPLIPKITIPQVVPDKSIIQDKPNERYKLVTINKKENKEKISKLPKTAISKSESIVYLVLSELVGLVLIFLRNKEVE